jgi:hypothetical protein
MEVPFKILYDKLGTGTGGAPTWFSWCDSLQERLDQAEPGSCRGRTRIQNKTFECCFTPTRPGFPSQALAL